METPNLIISDQDFATIMSVIGYPIVSLEDLTNNMMTRSDIENQLIFNAMLEYYKFFPLEEVQEYQVAGDFHIPFPDDKVFVVTDARVVLRTYGGAGHSSSPFMNELLIRKNQGSKYGTRNDYDFFQVRQYARMETQGVLESFKTVRTKMNFQTKTVDGFSTIQGRLKITWGRFSENFSDIPMKHNRDVVKLAQSYILAFFGSIRQQAAANLPTDVSGDNFIEMAKELREEVITRWQDYSKITVIRG